MRARPALSSLLKAVQAGIFFDSPITHLWQIMSVISAEFLENHGLNNNPTLGKVGFQYGKNFKNYYIFVKTDRCVRAHHSRKPQQALRDQNFHMLLLVHVFAVRRLVRFQYLCYVIPKANTFEKRSKAYGSILAYTV